VPDFSPTPLRMQADGTLANSSTPRPSSARSARCASAVRFPDVVLEAPLRRPSRRHFQTGGLNGGS
jgi:hypothetical protein